MPLANAKFFPILLARIHDQVSCLILLYAQNWQVARSGTAREFAVLVKARAMTGTLE